MIALAPPAVMLRLVKASVSFFGSTSSREAAVVKASGLATSQPSPTALKLTFPSKRTAKEKKD